MQFKKNYTHPFSLSSSIFIDENDRKFQLNLWRQNSTDNLQVFQLYIVIFGTASALFSCKMSDGSKVVRNDFYVDDLFTDGENEVNDPKLSWF